MPDALRRPKLNREQKDFVLMCIAREHSPSVVVSELQTEYGVTVTRQNIEAYKKKFKELIAEKRRMFLASMDKIPLFEKAERIWAYQKLYDDFLKVSAGIRTPEVIDVLSGLIEKIRREVEPIKIKGEGFESSNITNVINVKELDDFLGGVHNGDVINRAEDIKRRANGAGQERFASTGDRPIES